MTTVKTLTIRTPDDFHLHLRALAVLVAVFIYTAKWFARALIMPNTKVLKDPGSAHIRNAKLAKSYQRAIVDVGRKVGADLEPLITMYITERTTPKMIFKARKAGVIAAKLYPRGATTASKEGVRIAFIMSGKLKPVLDAMAECGMVLCVHGEDPDAESDAEREEAFMPVACYLVTVNKKLKVVFEHISTGTLADFVKKSREGVAGTVTAHHLFANVNNAFGRNHYICRPQLNHPRHQRALIEAVTTNEDGKFFFGSDSAPHLEKFKHCAVAATGCFTAPAALSILATVFERAGKLHQLERFTSRYGAEFYGLPLNTGTITLKRVPYYVPQCIHVEAGDWVVPFLAGEELPWSVVSRSVA